MTRKVWLLLLVAIICIIQTINGNINNNITSTQNSLTTIIPTLIAAPQSSTHNCVPKILNTIPIPPKALSYITIATDAASIISKFPKHHSNITREAIFVRTIFNQHTRIFAIAIISPDHHNLLAYRKRDRLLIHRNRTIETEPFWKVIDFIKQNNGGNTWSPPLRDCILNRGTWYQGYLATAHKNFHVAIFIPVVLNQCDLLLADIFGGRHKCDDYSTKCVPKTEYGLKRGGYKCVCRERFYFPDVNNTWTGFSGEDIENELVIPRCSECPTICDRCDHEGQCMAHPDLVLRSAVLGVQVTCMGVTIIIGIVVFKQRKCKTIASGMWTILETILLGIFLLYSTIVIRFFEPSVERCILEAWARELGFIICYGAIVLKLYRHLIDFRTRKAHRWVVKDTDLLKYLFVMIAAVFAYLSAYTATTIDFLNEHFNILITSSNTYGMNFLMCKPLLWDYVTQCAELFILIFGIHLSYASRNAATQFQERRFLCAAVSVELALSGIFYIIRPMYLPYVHPDHEYLAYFIRSQLTTTIVLALLFIPKLWYQHKQARSLAQEFSCRLPVDAFKPVQSCNTHGPLMSNNSDVDVGEITLADMSPDDIRAELKRLYTQLEILKNKTLRANNPHISKRRGGRKVAHRRFSLQALHGKHHRSHKHNTSEVEVTEGEMSRTPEDSVCSGEGPSAIYNDLASTYSELIGTPNAAALIKPPPSSSSQ
ncbi:probable G-protein coupled receptor 158 isoform X2 [Chrysoperla carnea]|uniref:probable G-protein coupled receptor 158 isoform X2 n=1 Tax=Chrysoperla carnea TaxID=189513 RepID=UPI001D0809E1|nr:probable G-protein coupled receptor 158 isoform X2 [Chrysoperla carnea]